jgi:ApeA N-terminal domain 1
VALVTGDRLVELGVEMPAATAAESYHEARFDGRVVSNEAWAAIVDAATGAATSADLADQIRNRMAALNQPSLRDRIQDLVDRGGDPLRGLLPDPDGTAGRASRLRNKLSHGSSTNTRNREIFDTTDELLLVLEFHFLREAGFTDADAAARLKAASRSFSGLWLRHGRDKAHTAVPGSPSASAG